MNSFFGNLHWRMPLQPTPTHRWTTWARSLSAVRRRIYSRHLAAVMHLLRPSIPIHRSTHRWELHAVSLFPRINLVVRPILLQSDKSSSVDSRSSSRSLISASQLQRDFLRSVRTPGHSLLKSRHLVKADGLPAQRGRVASPVLALLNRVFRRLVTPDVQIEHRKLLTTESVKVARRVIAEAQRIEHYGPTAMVTKQDAMARKIFVSARGSETKLQEQLNELSKTVPEIIHGKSPFATPVNGLTIEQLTEQVMRRIDDQIVAHKERMGKVF